MELKIRCQACKGTRNKTMPVTVLAGKQTWFVCHGCLESFRRNCGQEFKDALLNPPRENVLCACINEERQERKLPTIEPAWTTPKENQVEAIAKAFAAVLKRDLSAEHFEEMIKLNDAEQDHGICHSHDHCDANMAMDEAYRIVMGFAPELNDDASIDLWNEAWYYAKSNRFFEPREQFDGALGRMVLEA